MGIKMRYFKGTKIKSREILILLKMEMETIWKDIKTTSKVMKTP